MHESELPISNLDEQDIDKALIIEDRYDRNSYDYNEIENKIILGDCLNVLPKLKGELFDLVFWDPPYFLQLPSKKLKRWKVQTEVDAVQESWDKFESFSEYDLFIEKTLLEIKRLLKSSGTLWIIGTYHNIFRIGRILQDLGFWILNDVVWVKSNPMPNWLGVRFTNATETLIWVLRDKKSKNYIFNRQYAKEFGFGKTGTNVWVFPICQGKERLRNADGSKIHPTQKPIELLKRIILTSTDKGAFILDPMAGTGTTAYVAKALERKFLMIEREPKYVEAIAKRLKTPMNARITKPYVQIRNHEES